MSFIKVPLLILGGVAAVAGITPPAHALPEERVKPNGIIEKLFSIIIDGLFLLMRSLLWVATVAEVAVICASGHTNSFSSFVVKLLGNSPSSSSSLSLQGIRITAPFLISLALVICSAFVRLSCYRALGNFFTFRIALRKGHQLITTGPYAYVRHPSYTAIVILLFSATHAFFAPGSWAYEFLGLRWKSEALIMIICAGPSVFVSLDRSIKEDEILRSQFGGEWNEWAKRVPYRLVPYVW